MNNRNKLFSLIATVILIFITTKTVSGEIFVSGELAKDTTWSGSVVLEETVTVPADMTLNIEPGTIVSMKNSVSLIVRGQLIADGNEAEPISFTRYEPDTTWKQIMFVEAENSRFTHCTFEYADCEGAHQDYYEPGPRNYHEAIVALATHLDFEGCTFQNLPDNSSRAEGDAMAIIADDPNHPGEASATFRNCQFLSIGQGVHTRFSYVLVEDCFFTGKHGDNDDVDLWGESTPAPVIRNNLFLNPEQEDMINPTRCSAIITGNVIIGSDDHGVVLRDKGFPVMMNNLIINCSTAGIAIENSCEALLVNNTIVNCGRGLRLFDLGRWGPPYRLNPGGGTATVINCIIWDCPQPVTLADSSSTEIEDTGSHITISYSDIPGGQDGVIISGNNSTLTWGPGNINIDPQFADPANGDYHLKSQAGRWEPNSEIWIMDQTSSPCIDAGDPNSPVAFEPSPNGGIINMGVYGGTGQTSKSPSGIHAKYGGGTGEPNDPYLIYTAEQMNTIGANPNDWDKHFKLMADIDLSAYKGTEFNIIGNNSTYFTGTFDGNKHNILNLTYSSTDSNAVGLIATMGDSSEGENIFIKNLILVNPQINAPQASYVGALVGKLVDGTISCCAVQHGNVNGNEVVGGLIGGSTAHPIICWIAFGRINDCYSSASISGKRKVGGLMGICGMQPIIHCYSVGRVEGNEVINGLAGDYWYGLAENYGYVLEGDDWFSFAEESFWDIETSGQTTSAGGIGKTTAEMQTASTFLEAGWDFVDETENGTEDIWWILEGRDYPRLYWELTNNLN